MNESFNQSMDLYHADFQNYLSRELMLATWNITIKKEYLRLKPPENPGEIQGYLRRCNVSGRASPRHSQTVLGNLTNDFQNDPDYVLAGLWDGQPTGTLKLLESFSKCDYEWLRFSTLEVIVRIAKLLYRRPVDDELGPQSQLQEYLFSNFITVWVCDHALPIREKMFSELFQLCVTHAQDTITVAHGILQYYGLWLQSFRDPDYTIRSRALRDLQAQPGFATRHFEKTFEVLKLNITEDLRGFSGKIIEWVIEIMDPFVSSLIDDAFIRSLASDYFSGYASERAPALIVKKYSFRSNPTLRLAEALSDCSRCNFSTFVTALEPERLSWSLVVDTLIHYHTKLNGDVQLVMLDLLRAIPDPEVDFDGTSEDKHLAVQVKYLELLNVFKHASNENVLDSLIRLVGRRIGDSTIIYESIINVVFEIFTNNYNSDSIARATTYLIQSFSQCEDLDVMIRDQWEDMDKEVEVSEAYKTFCTAVNFCYSFFGKRVPILRERISPRDIVFQEKIVDSLERVILEDPSVVDSVSGLEGTSDDFIISMFWLMVTLKIKFPDVHVLNASLDDALRRRMLEYRNDHMLCLSDKYSRSIFYLQYFILSELGFLSQECTRLLSTTEWLPKDRHERAVCRALRGLDTKKLLRDNCLLLRS